MPPQFDDDLAVDVAAVGAHAASPGRRSASMPVTRVCGWICTPACAGQAGQRVAELRRVDVAVRGEVGRADHARRVHQREQLLRPRPARSPAAAGRRSCAQLICRRISSSRSGDDASRMPPHSTQPGGVLGLPAAAGRARRSTCSSGSASGRRAAGRPGRREWNVDPLVSSARSTQHDVGLAELGEVVGDARAADAATDDDDRGRCRQADVLHRRARRSLARQFSV